MIDQNIDPDNDDVNRLLTLAIKCEDEGDTESAISLYKFCIYFGDETSMTRLADILSEPPNFRDLDTAIVLYKKACLKGDSSACNNLAILYQQLGQSVAYQKFMRLAKERGDPWQSD
jgi:TPR repeat protein